MIKFLLFFCIILPPGVAAQVLPDIIEWSNTRLGWSNFKGRYDTATFNRRHFATTFWKLRYQYKPLKGNNLLSFEVVAWFDARKSWVRPAHRNTGLLQHEQGHFDLAEIFAGQFRRQVAQTIFPKKGFADSINSVFNRLLAQAYSMQQQYDRETAHGENKIKQMQWQARIATLLKELLPYSKQHFTARLQP